MDRENMSLSEVVKSTLSLLLAIFIVASIISLSAGGVETATYCDTLTFAGKGLKGHSTLPLFHPGLGRLVDVGLAVDLGVLQNYSLENEENEAHEVSAKSESVLIITLPDGRSIPINASSAINEKLAAYDGKTDFAGASGKRIEASSKGTFQEKYQELSDFTASFQNETISLPVDISFTSSTSGSLVFRLSTIAESKVCVTYTYEPDGSG